MTEWFYVRDGQQNGPVTLEQLVELAKTGGLDATKDSVWNESMQGWTPANQVPEIFNASIGRVARPTNSANPYAAPESNWTKSADLSAITLEEIEPGSDVIDPIACMTRGVEILRRQFLTILLAGLVYFACEIGISMVSNGMQMLLSSGNQNNESMSWIILGFMFLIQIALQVFLLLLKLGFLRIGLNLISGKEASIGMLFGEGNKLLRVIGASILYFLAVLIGMLLLVAPGVYIMLRYGQFMTAIVDRDLGIMEAFEYSSSITTNNRLNLFLLALLSFFAVILGILLCFVGLFFFGPVVWLAGLVAYRWMQYGRLANEDHPGTEIPKLNGL